MTTLFPPVPTEVPVLVETSFSLNEGPEAHGIDIATQWWCEAIRRSRRGDSLVRVVVPGVGFIGLPHPLLTLIIPTDDLYETEAAAHYAIRVARQVVRLINDHADAEATAELKILFSSLGPMGIGSQGAWHALLEWLPLARASRDLDDTSPLQIHGWGVLPELWSVTQVAKYLGYSGPSAEGSARRQLSRWDLTPEGREVGRRGQSQYLADQVREKHENRPGSGRRGATRKGGRFIKGDS